LLRSLLAMYVLVPLAAVLLVRFLPLNAPVAAALLVLAVSAGAPLLPRKLSKVESGSYPLSLVFVSSLLAIVLVPAGVYLLAQVSGRTIEVTPLVVAKSVAQAFLAPLAVGLVIRMLLPKFALKVAEPLLAIAGIVLVVSGLVLLVAAWKVLLDVHFMGFVAVVLLLIVSLAIGQAMGGPDPEHRTSLAIACATRHIGLAILVAASFPGVRTMTMMLGYVLTAALVTTPYLKWRGKVHARATAAAPAAGTPGA
jgi:BASS family bile acid:Na+ symporter